MPHRKHLSIEERNEYERKAIALGKARGYEKQLLTGFVEGWMDAALLFLEPQPKTSTGEKLKEASK